MIYRYLVIFDKVQVQVWYLPYSSLDNRTPSSNVRISGSRNGVRADNEPNRTETRRWINSTKPSVPVSEPLNELEKRRLVPSWLVGELLPAGYNGFPKFNLIRPADLCGRWADAFRLRSNCFSLLNYVSRTRSRCFTIRIYHRGR